MASHSRARRRFGQNFLVDPRAVERILSLLDPRPGQRLLEIGPGRGALTARLIERAGTIAAVELDRDLARTLRQRFDDDALWLIEGDVLDLEARAVLDGLGAGHGERLTVVGNLPYNISKPVAQKLLEWRRDVSRAVLMFQREVALRLTAGPGSRDYGPLGVLAGLCYGIECRFDLPPRAFRPVPKVVSTVTEWRPREQPLSPAREAAVRAVLATAFRHRRRTLHNNLRETLGDERTVAELLARAEVDGSLRAEALPPKVFLRLADAWPRLDHPGGPL